MINSQSGAPADYAELYESYFGMMKSIVWRAGINAGDVEDVAAEILCKFMEKDALTWFDPERMNDAGENPRTKGARMRPARFSNLLKRFTELYVRQWLDKQRALERREPSHAKLDASASGTQGLSWVEANEDRFQGPLVDVATETRMVLFSVVSGVHGKAQDAARTAEEESGAEVFWKNRLSAQRAARDAARQHEGLLAAMQLAESGEAVTGVALARACGWSTQVGSRVLKGVRAELRVAGF
jgi:hypothetical protein